MPRSMLPALISRVTFRFSTSISLTTPGYSCDTQARLPSLSATMPYGSAATVMFATMAPLSGLNSTTRPSLYAVAAASLSPIQVTPSGFSPTRTSRTALRPVVSTTVTEPLSALAASRNLPSGLTSSRLFDVPPRTIGITMPAHTRTRPMRLAQRMTFPPEYHRKANRIIMEMGRRICNRPAPAVTVDFLLSGGGVCRYHPYCVSTEEIMPRARVAHDRFAEHALAGTSRNSHAGAGKTGRRAGGPLRRAEGAAARTGAARLADAVSGAARS